MLSICSFFIFALCHQLINCHLCPAVKQTHHTLQPKIIQIVPNVHSSPQSGFALPRPKMFTPFCPHWPHILQVYRWNFCYFTSCRYNSFTSINLLQFSVAFSNFAHFARAAHKQLPMHTVDHKPNTIFEASSHNPLSNYSTRLSQQHSRRHRF